MATDSRLPLVLATLFFVGLAAQGTQADVLALVYGVVPCSSNSSSSVIRIDGSTFDVFPNASVQLVVNSDDESIPRAITTTDEDGQFLIALNVSTGEQLASLMSDSTSKVVVTTPPVACNASLPDVGTLTATVRPIGSRSLGDSAMGTEERCSLLVDLVGGIIEDLLATESMAVGDFGDDCNLLSGLLGGDSGGAVDAFSVFGVGPFSYSADN